MGRGRVEVRLRVQVGVRVGIWVTLRRALALLAAEDEVDPLVQVRGDVLALEGRAVLAHEVVRVLGPRRQLHVVQRDAVLPRAQVETVRVAQQLGVVEEVGQQLL